jgi:hypothetical protein
MGGSNNSQIIRIEKLKKRLRLIRDMEISIESCKTSTKTSMIKVVTSSQARCNFKITISCLLLILLDGKIVGRALHL